MLEDIRKRNIDDRLNSRSPESIESCESAYCKMHWEAELGRGAANKNATTGNGATILSLTENERRSVHSSISIPGVGKRPQEWDDDRGLRRTFGE
jgi:hypothetical protein